MIGAERFGEAFLLNQLQRYAEAQVVLTDLWTVFRNLDDKASEATALLNMGSNALLGQNSLQEAVNTLETARRLFESLEDPQGLGQTWGDTGSVHRIRQEWPEVVNAYRRACAALDDAGDQHNAAKAHEHLGDVLPASD